MTTVVVLLVVLLVTIVCLVWPDSGESWKWPRKVRDRKHPDRPAPAAARTSSEGVLVAQLLAHEISPLQYRHAVERLARIARPPAGS
jgi:hypothetical protein